MIQTEPEAIRSAGASRHAAQARAAFVLGAAIVALQMLDVLTTLAVVSAGGREANPAVSVLMTLLGPVWWVPKVIIASCIAGYFGTRPTVRWTGLLVLLLGALVVFNNIAQLRAT